MSLLSQVGNSQAQYDLFFHRNQEQQAKHLTPTFPTTDILVINMLFPICLWFSQYSPTLVLRMHHQMSNILFPNFCS